MISIVFFNITIAEKEKLKNTQVDNFNSASSVSHITSFLAYYM